MIKKLIFPLKNSLGVPDSSSPGSFGFTRKYDIHTGVDIYTDFLEPVFSMEDGKLVDLGIFTGKEVGSPWWNTTHFVGVLGKTGYFIYGEILIAENIIKNKQILAGELLGYVVPVLKKFKGKNPTTMLHIELYKKISDPVTWNLGDVQPKNLIDPTFYLLQALNNSKGP